MTAEDIERRRRESRISSLLMDDEDDILDKTYDARLMSRLLTHIKPYRGKMISAVALMIGASLLGVAGPWIVGKAIDDGIRAGDMHATRVWTMLLLGAALGELGLNRARILIMAYVGTKLVTDMRSGIFRHLHKLSLSFHNTHSVGRLMSRLISDVGALQDFMTWWFTGMARSAFILLGIIAAMLLMNWKLALVTFSMLPLMIILTNYWRKHVRSAYRAARIRLSLINGYLNESITGIRVTKSFTREDENARHFADLNRSYFDANIETTRLSSIFFPGVDFMGSLASALVVGVGGWMMFSNVMTAGVLVAFLLYVDRFFDPVREMAERYNIFQKTMAASERIFGLIDTTPEIRDAPDAIPLPRILGTIDFDNVNFAYKPQEQVLRGVSIHAKHGQRIALVGETGSGKSTIIRLLARFFDVTGGSIRVDGHDIRGVTLESLRSQLGIVLQETFIFGGTIADNIRYGRIDASHEEIRVSAKSVGAHKFIMDLPDGYDTDVGENGVNLSVGQCQLVSFARALLSDPRILILDEATSSIDTTTEKQIQEALDVLVQGRTSFVIAHRLNTIINSDQIVVLDHGMVIEQGTHEELIARKGRYYNLYTMQWTREQT